MLHICATRFEVTKNFKNFVKFLGRVDDRDDPDYVDVSIFSREIHLQNYVGSPDKLGNFIDAWVKTGGRCCSCPRLSLHSWQGEL